MTTTPQARLQATRRRKLKLYVWDDVFSSYHSGMAFALAYDVGTARRLVAQEYAGRGSKRGDSMFDSAMRELAGQPRVVPLDENTTPEAWQISGGD